MSKSQGNVIAPQQVMNTLGADILRLWVAAADYRQEMSVSDEILKRVADAYRRIRNTARFLLGNLNGFDPVADAIPDEQLLPLDRYVVDLAAGLQAQIQSAYADYRFFTIYQRLHHFCSVDMGAFYLDVIKDRLYTLPVNHPARRSAQTAMQHVLEALVRWLAPLCCFTAEEIWAEMKGERESSVMLATWYEHLPAFAADDRAFWNRLRAVREAVGPTLEALRRSKAIGSSLAAEITLEANGQLAQDLARVGDELRFFFISSDVVLGLSGPEATEASIDGDTLKFSVRATEHGKCVRCWHYRDSVGENADHPELCGRCVGNIGSDPEQRVWV
jgi:isoleucyl-tRNA synthetase